MRHVLPDVSYIVIILTEKDILIMPDQMMYMKLKTCMCDANSQLWKMWIAFEFLGRTSARTFGKKKWNDCSVRF